MFFRRTREERAKLKKERAEIKELRASLEKEKKHVKELKETLVHNILINAKNRKIKKE